MLYFTLTFFKERISLSWKFIPGAYFQGFAKAFIPLECLCILPLLLGFHVTDQHKDVHSCEHFS